MKKKTAWIVGIVAAVMLIVVLVWNFNAKKDPFDEHLEEVAADTYEFFITYTNEETGLTADRVDMGDSINVSPHTSPTNIAMYVMSTVAAVEMDLIPFDEGEERVAATLQTLEQMEKWNGLFYNWYFIDDGALMVDWGQFISTVDNGWLTAGLVVAGQYFPELADQTGPLVEAMDYSTLYDDNAHLFYGGYDVATESLTNHHYGTLYSETRITSYLAIGKGDVPEVHWWHLLRTNPPKDTWQSQIPEGDYVTIDGVQVYQGHYEYEGIEYVPSWGGSMFEALMPGLVIDELALGENALGLNNARHVAGQIKYAEMNDLDAWGFSPASLPNGYSEFGAPVLGISGYEDHSTVTPHAAFMALDYDREAVESNLAVLRDLDMYGEYGYYDSVNLISGERAEAYLSLDQGMIMLAIANHLHDSIIREQFHNDPIGSTPERLLSEEEFFIQ